MIKINIGLKGSGKTPKLIEAVNTAIDIEKGNVVCITEGNRLMHDITQKVRMINTEHFDIKNIDVFEGLLCGIITVPIGCFVAGLVCKLPLLLLFLDLLPLIILAVIVGAALIFAPKICVKCFQAFGFLMKTVAIIGLVCAIFTFLSGIEISPHFDTLENAAFICVNACVTLSGALPAMYLMAKLLHKPLGGLGRKIGINSISTVALLGTLVTNASTFGTMEKMDKKGTVLNAAFAVSAAFVFGSHLAFTMAFDKDYIVPMIIGKLISGICAVALALLLYKGDAQESAAKDIL